MTHTIDDSLAKRNLVILITAQAVLGAQMAISFILGGLAGQYLSPNPCLATLPISLIILGSMLSAPVMSSIMQKYGRRAGFHLGVVAGGLSAAIQVYALYTQSFQLFLVGGFLTGIYMSAQGFYRFAATDTASPEFMPKAISWVMAGGLLAAIIGPQLVKLTQDALAPVPFAGAYLTVIALNIFGIFLFMALKIPKPKPVEAGQPSGRTIGQLLRTPQIAVAIISSMVAYSLMNLVMTSTPLAVVGCGFETDQAADIVSAHVLAMYMPSFFTGYFINWFGVRKVIAAGLVILGAAGITALNGVEIENFYAALILLGIGWNFGFIGGTTMLAASHKPEERGRVQGLNDFLVFGMVTLASLSSGGLMNCSGGSAQEGWQAVNLAMLPLLALAGGALLWFAISGKDRDPV
ncbi:MAG: MFS transporter [Rhodobacteraceae bacterium]|nr:MFS transporter [Paracoccaceae bacterium]